LSAWLHPDPLGSSLHSQLLIGFRKGLRDRDGTKEKGSEKEGWNGEIKRGAEML